MLGGDHSLKFGVGWRKQPDHDVLALQRRRARPPAVRREHQRQLRQRRHRGRRIRDRASCPYQAVLYRDQLRNNDWWTYNGYIQDSFSTAAAGASTAASATTGSTPKYLGGCVPENVIRPDLLPAQCEDATETDTITGQEAPVVQQLVAARVGDLRPVRQRQDVGEGQRGRTTTTRGSRWPTTSAACSPQTTLDAGARTSRAARAARRPARRAGPTPTATRSSRPTS